ncbi:MAG: sulfatase-like hydrolase/transferase, partial [Planctomycetota bacterium]
MPNARSNILLVQCDSMDGRLMGCMGHPAAVTPHMDRMAERGVLFRNAYCNSPLCVPSRASMFSGLYTHHCEAWNNINGLEETTPTFLNRFTAGGYATLVHGGTDYLSGQHTLRAQLSAHTRSANLHLPVWPKLKPPRVEKTNPRRRTPIDMASLDWPMLDRFCEALTASATSSQPFFAYCGIGTPHPPFSTLQYWHDLIDPEKIDMPGQTQWRHPTADYKRAVFRLNDALPPETIRAYRRVYLAMIAETDAMLGQVLETLEKTKAADSTCVIFISDHGEMAFEHGQHAKMTLYDPAVRVPMIVTG